MRIYTDVSVTLKVDGCDLSTINNIHVTFRSGEAVIDVVDVMITGEHELTAVLTQEQTKDFQVGQGADVQMNYFDEFGLRHASDIAHIPVGSNLLRRILNE